MPKYDFHLTTIIQTLEDGSFLAESLFFPDVSRYGNSAVRLREAMGANASQQVQELEPIELHRRRATGPVSLRQIDLIIQPPVKSAAWAEPVTLRFHAVCYEHGEEARVAYVVELGIEIVAQGTASLDDAIESRVRAHLLRLKVGGNLKSLVLLQRPESVELVESQFSATVRTPKQEAARASTETARPVLEEVGTDLSKERLAEAYEIDELVERIADATLGSNPVSVLLVGPSGVGKTAVIHEFVRRRASPKDSRRGTHGIQFWATTGSRLVAGMSGFGMWQERCAQLCREASKAKAVIYFGNLLELMEVGKSVSNQEGIAAFFRPYLRRGEFTAIAECTPEQLSLIERSDPQLLSVFSQITVDPPSIERGKKILRRFMESERRSRLDSEALETVDRLHRRYVTYSAYPGRPLRFLKGLLEDHSDKESITSEEVINRFSGETGMPLFLLSRDVPIDMDETREWFSGRIIGQGAAVDLSVGLVATIKADLTRRGKPIASLLFIGPTGVGKTEMARRLAEFLFGNSNRMIRFDMSEFGDPVSVGRLIGGAWGSEGQLTSKVREEPFSVILLDEFEKADPSFFDLLLQVLGEGRLTDTSGRLAIFSNSVVIMTSNLGAETFRQSPLGFGGRSNLEATVRDHFTKEVRSFVRPELFNRIDAIIPFSSLGEDEVLSIARREIDNILSRDGIKYRGITVNVPDDVTRHLANKGFHPKYGARQLKRAIESEFLAPLSRRLNDRTWADAVTVHIERDNGTIVPSITARAGESAKSAARAGTAPAVITSRVLALRREIQQLQRSSAMQELATEISRLEYLEKRLARSSWKSPEDLKRIARLPDLQKRYNAVGSLAEKVNRLEEEALLSLYGVGEPDSKRYDSEVTAYSSNWEEMILDIYAFQFEDPDYITLAVFSENARWLFQLAGAYHQAAMDSSAGLQVCAFCPAPADAKTARRQAKTDEPDPLYMLGRTTARRDLRKPEDWIQAERDGAVCIAIGIAEHFSFPRYRLEEGIHVLVGVKHSERALVDSSQSTVEKYGAPAQVRERGSIPRVGHRRRYDFVQGAMEDTGINKTLPLHKSTLSRSIREAMELRLIAEARSTLDQ